MLNEFLSIFVGSSLVFSTLNPDVIIRVGEYHNKPGKRVYLNDTDYIHEFDINIRLSKRIVYYLREQGVHTELQIANDKSEDLNSAGKIAMSKSPKIYFSVHHNSFEEDSSGIFLMVNQESPSDYKYAQILSELLNDNPMNIPVYEVREQNGYIGEMNETDEIINILLEAGFYSNPDELQKIMNEEQIDYLAKVIATNLKWVLSVEATK